MSNATLITGFRPAARGVAGGGLRRFAGYPLWLGAIAFLATAWPCAAQIPSQPAPAESQALVRASLAVERPIIQAGQPVWIDFSLTNLTDDPLTLQVPEAPAIASAGDQMGLPLAHVFSGKNFSALEVKDSRGEVFDEQVSQKPRLAVPIVYLAPHGTVGMRVDVTRYYESLLHRPAKYTLVWRPYGGTVESAPLTVTILAEQQAVIMTDLGKMIVRFYYNEAPNHVQNFIELVGPSVLHDNSPSGPANGVDDVSVRKKFYDGLTFHRVIPGGIIQGGDPRGDGKGTRPDGKRLPAEFSKIVFEMGTVGMARSPKDPDSASCQFFICLSRQPSFDGEQTAFGYLVGDESFETLRKIAAVPTGPNDRPRKPIYIRAISLENVPVRERVVAPSPSNGATTRPAVAQGMGPVQPIFPPRRENVYKLAKPKEPAATRPAGVTGG